MVATDRKLINIKNASKNEEGKHERKKEYVQKYIWNDGEEK